MPQVRGKVQDQPDDGRSPSSTVLLQSSAPTPEQSTLAIVAHHPQAFYFGMKQGKLKPAGATAPDDLVKGSKRDPSLFGVEPEIVADDADPLEGGVAEGEGEAAPVPAEA